MCGRYTLVVPLESLHELFGCEGGGDFQPRYNVAPLQEAPVIRRDEDDRRRIANLRWGLIPAWAKDPSIAPKLINARAEGVADKASFRGAFARRRCIVPVDGFYEWQPAGKRKQPYRITLPDGAPFALAGLWERWAPPGGPAVETFVIITTAANEQLRALHDRMPAILPPEAVAIWLDPSAPRPVLESLLVPYAGPLRLYPVDPRVGNARYDDPGLIEPLAEQAQLL